MQPSNSYSKWLKLLVGFAVSVGLIWWAFRDTEFSDVWQLAKAMKPVPMIFAVVLATLPFLLRVPRWALLLRREDGSELPANSLWHAIAIGFAANNVLPYRLGEVARMGAISRLERIPFPSSLASVAVERMIDAITAISLFALGLLITELPASPGSAGKARLVAVVAILALCCALAVAKWPALATRPVSALVPSGRVRDLLLDIIRRLVDGLGALADPKRAALVLLWSLIIWTVNASAFWVAFSAFGIDVPFSGALILQGMLLVGISIPSTPGYAGVFDVTIMLALSQLFGVPEELGLAYAITYHVLTFVPITLLGVASLMSTGLTVRSATAAATE